jgi:hypothetical protein
MTNQARALTHIAALAEEMKNTLDPTDTSPAMLFVSGAINGLAMAKRIIDGGTAEQAMEALEANVAAVVGRMYLAGQMPPVQPKPTGDIGAGAPRGCQAPGA